MVEEPSLKVLIVDDAEDDARLLVRHLRASGLRLLHRHVGSLDGLNAAMEGDRWDVVLCNHSRPGQSPVETLRCVRRHDHHVPLIVVSGAIDEGELVRLVKLGAQDIVPRDDLARLKPAIERELAEAQWRRERDAADQRLVSAIESIAEGMALYDREDRLNLCNRRYREILDRCSQRIIPGARFEDMLRYAALHGQFGDHLGPEVEDFIQARLARRRNPGIAFEQSLSDGRWIRIHEQRTCDGGLITVLTDITERKTLEAMKKDFFSAVVHELRTPLTAIAGSLALVGSGAAGRLPDKAAAMVALAHANTERLARLVDDNLDGEKLESGTMTFSIRPVALAPLLVRAQDGLEGYLDRCGVSLKLDLPAEPRLVMADPDRLVQVLNNLISNAAKFSPEGETVTLGAERRADHVRITVSDHGPGIAEEFRHTIFDRFTQANASDRRQLGSTGLGLSIAKEIVERLGGQLDFESRVGHGTTFHFDLPTARDRRRARPWPVPARANKVLVIDHDRNVRRRIRQMMTELGYDATACASADTARKRLNSASYAAITLGFALPQRGAVAFIDELRRASRTEDLPIIAIATEPAAGSSELCGQAVDIVDWVDNPLDFERLRSAIERVARDLAGRRPGILHVASDRDQLEVVARNLKDLGDVERARTAQDASRLLCASAYDLVILDPLLLRNGGLRLPDGGGAGGPRLLISPVRPVRQSHLECLADALAAERAGGTNLSGQIRALLSSRRAEAAILSA